MEKNKKKISNTLKLLLALVLLAAAGLGIGVYRYVSNVPKLTPKNWLQDVVTDNTFQWNTLYNVKCSGSFSVELSILDTNIPDAEIIDGKNALYVGSKAGYIHLSAVGQGKRSEYGKAADTYIYTSYGADEQSAVTEKLKAALEYVDKAAKEQYFKGEEAELLRCAASMVVHNYSDNMDMIYPVYYTEYKNSSGGSVYLKIETTLDLSSDDPAPSKCTVKEEELYDSSAGLVANFKNLFTSSDVSENMVICDSYRINRLSPGFIMDFDPKECANRDSWSEEARNIEIRHHFIYYIIDIM